MVEPVDEDHALVEKLLRLGVRVRHGEVERAEFGDQTHDLRGFAPARGAVVVVVVLREGRTTRQQQSEGGQGKLHLALS